MDPKDYHCPVCGADAAPQIMRTFPPKVVKCMKCGFVEEEQRFLRAPEPRQDLPA